MPVGDGDGGGRVVCLQGPHEVAVLVVGRPQVVQRVGQVEPVELVQGGAQLRRAGGGVLVVIGTVIAALAAPAFVRYRVTRRMT